MKNFHIGLLPRIIIAIILGILFGNFLPASLVRLFVTFNAIFSEFLNFSIPLIIVGLVTIAIADIGKGAGRMLVVTALIAYGATLFSGFLSYFTGMAVFPSLIETGVPLEEVSESQGILPYFSVGIPPLMNVMDRLVPASLSPENAVFGDKKAGCPESRGSRTGSALRNCTVLPERADPPSAGRPGDPGRALALQWLPGRTSVYSFEQQR